MHMLDGGMDAACDTTLVARWLRMTSRDDALLAIQRWRSAGYGRFATRLAFIAGISNKETASIDTGVARDQSEWNDPDQINMSDSSDSSMTTTTTCDASLLHDGALMLHDAVHAAIISQVRDTRVSSAMSAALCLACSQHSSELYEVGNARADAVASDARTILASAMQDGSAASEPREYSDRFALDTVSAALQKAPDEDVIAAVRGGWDVCANATIAALQKAHRDALKSRQSVVIETDIAAVQRALHLQRALIGNAYCPALFAPAGLSLPDASEVSRTIDLVIRSTMDRERRRVDLTNALLGEHLGAAREEASQRRVISASVKLTVGMFMQWCASGMQPAE